MKKLIWILCLLALSCGPVTPPPMPTPPRPVAVRTCAFPAHVILEGGAPRVFKYEADTDMDGVAHFPAIAGDISTTNIHLHAAGYPDLDTVASFKPRNTDFNVQGCAPVIDPSYQVQLPEWKPFFKPLSALHAEGEFLVQDNGTRWVGIEASSFNLLNRWQHGEDIKPVLQQYKDLGFNLLRVWTLYDQGTGAGDFRDIDYARVGPFLDVLAGYGLYADMTAYAGNLTYRADHWDRLCAAVQGRTNVLLSPVNELEASPSNWIDISGIQKCAGVLTSSGSNGSQAWPPTQVSYTPDWLEFHDNDADEWWRKGSHNAMEVAQGAYPIHLPTITNEQTRFDKMQGTDQQIRDRVFGDAQGCVILVAGCAFHSNEGKTASLLIGAVLNTAQQHVAGMTSRQLFCQLAGAYVHRDDLELNLWLRVYQRGSDTNCIGYIPF